MPPVLLSSERTQDGRAVLTWSVRPGRRVRVVAATWPVTAADLDAMLRVKVPAITPKERA